MSVGELENRRLACFVSLVSAHQHQLPVVSEGAALDQPPHLGQTDKRLIFPLFLASTLAEFSIERDLLPSLLGEGGKVQGWGRKAPAFVPGYLCVLRGCYGKAEKSQATGLGQMVLCFSLAQLWD